MKWYFYPPTPSPCVYLCVGVHVEARGWYQLSFQVTYPFYFLRQCLTEPATCWLAKFTGLQPSGTFYFCLSSTWLGYRHARYPTFQVGVRDPNSGVLVKYVNLKKNMSTWWPLGSPGRCALCMPIGDYLISLLMWEDQVTTGDNYSWLGILCCIEDRVSWAQVFFYFLTVDVMWLTALSSCLDILYSGAKSQNKPFLSCFLCFITAMTNN